MRFSTTILISASLLTIVACKSTPEPEPVEAAAPVTQAEPVFVPAPTPAPQSIAPVIQAPAPDLPIPGSIADFAYQSGEDRIYFGYDQYNLSAEARDVLSKQAAWLSTYEGVEAVIEGHADERGTREYNLALGARRAEAVKAFLVAQGVSPRRLITVSYGKERPIDGRSNTEGWARNRNGYTNIQSGAVG